jgi:hypothetical protein
MSDDSSLRAKAREALEAGNLPSRSPDELWGGFATGDLCAVCGLVIPSSDIELELQFTGGAAEPTTYHVHPHCFSILCLELGSRTNGLTGQ